MVILKALTELAINSREEEIELIEGMPGDKSIKAARITALETEIEQLKQTGLTIK